MVSGSVISMSPRERVATALRGGKPDCIPIVPVYDYGYVVHSIGKSMVDWRLATAQDRLGYVEDSFLRHSIVDGLVVHGGGNDDWLKSQIIEKHEDYWLLTDKATGEKQRLLPDGSFVGEDGSMRFYYGPNDDSFPVQSEADVNRLVGPPPTPEKVEYSGRFATMRYMTAKYPDRHFVTAVSSPLVRALGVCGGFEKGLITMMDRPEVFDKLQGRCAEREMGFLGPARAAGACSVKVTSYHTGADTLSPKIYAERVFPYERELCRAAREKGLFVLLWYLGDLMPNLDKVMELPIDALFLEQGRKNYAIDPVEIRKRVGPKFCLFGFAFENDFCTFNRDGLRRELARQIEGAGRDGAFVVGTSIMPPNADPAAVDYYFQLARELGKY